MPIVTTNGTKLEYTVLSRRAQETWDSKPMVSSTPDFNFLTRIILIKTCFKGEENILGYQDVITAAYVSDDRHTSSQLFQDIRNCVHGTNSEEEKWRSKSFSFSIGRVQGSLQNSAPCSATTLNSYCIGTKCRHCSDH